MHRAVTDTFRYLNAPSECPHCHGTLGKAAVKETKSGERYSLLRGEVYLDEDAEASTPRPSTDIAEV